MRGVFSGLPRNGIEKWWGGQATQYPIRNASGACYVSVLLWEYQLKQETRVLTKHAQHHASPQSSRDRCGLNIPEPPARPPPAPRPHSPGNNNRGRVEGGADSAFDRWNGVAANAFALRRVLHCTCTVCVPDLSRRYMNERERDGGSSDCML